MRHHLQKVTDGLLLVVLGVLLPSLITACSFQEESPSPSPTPKPTPTENATFTTATVKRVVDGVTIDVVAGGKKLRVRYLGVEIPVNGGTDGEEGNLAERALEFNTFLVDGRTVELENDVVETDLAGLELRYVYVNGEMVNEVLLTNGYATVTSFPPDFAYKNSFLVAEESAKRDQRGFWKRSSSPLGQEMPTPVPTTVPAFPGGTLPLPPGAQQGGAVCDYSDTGEPVIKGNVESRTGELIYHVPGGFFYATTKVEESEGDRWFCTEDEAIAAGWKRSVH